MNTALNAALPNLFHLELPAVVACSGGRTSGFMLRRILDAHGGQPDDLKVVFCNTGLEHAATYEFLREMAGRWDVAIDWIEYTLDDVGEHDFKAVNFETAARDGEPFTQLIEKKGYLPNPAGRRSCVRYTTRACARRTCSPSGPPATST